MMRGWVVIGLLLACLPALAASSLNVDDVAGVYKRQHVIAMYGEPPSRERVEDVLEVVKVSSHEAYIRFRLIFDNGHLCAFHGIVDAQDAALIYREPATISVFAGMDKPFRTVDTECVLTLKRDNSRIVFGDKDNVCRTSMCGARGVLTGAAFDLKSRKAIRYMPRLLASREYADAMSERAKK